LNTFGLEIKHTVDRAMKSENPKEALKSMKDVLTKYVESAYDKMDKLAPSVPAGDATALLDSAQTDIIHISESLDNVFNFLLSLKASGNSIVDEAAGRLSALVRSIDADEVQRVLDNISAKESPLLV